MSEVFNHGYALLIGVGESAYSSLSLPVTVKDTQAIYAALIDPELCGYPDNEEHVKVLNNQEATKNNILDGLKWLEEKAESDPEATIIVYYSGHGWVNKNDNQYYLLQHDINPLNIASSALSAETFTNSLRQIKAERLLVVIDSCHAAGMASSKSVEDIIKADKEFFGQVQDFQGAAPSKGLIETLKQGKGRVVFTSSRGEQKSWIKKDDSFSIYTYHFLEALQGAASNSDEKVVKVSNLMNHLSKSVPETVQKLYSQEQIPNYDMDAGDFAIAKLRGGKGLPDKGWEEVKTEAHQTIYKIADNITQHGKYIVNINEWKGGHLGDSY